MNTERRCFCPGDCACQAPAGMMRPAVCGCRQHDENDEARYFSAFPCHPMDEPCRPGGPEAKCRNHGGEHR